MTIKRIDSMADFVTGITAFQEQWNQIREDALIGALVDGGFVNDVIKRTPKSEYKRYADRKDGRRYGQARLLKSMVHSETAGSGTDFDILYERVDSFEVAFGPDANWDVPYAVRMHELKTPDSERSRPYKIRKVNPDTGRTKSYTRWTSGWSGSRTGNKYLEKPWNENEIRTGKQLVKNINEQLQEVGLL